MDIYNYQYYLDEALPYGNQYSDVWPFFSVFLSIFIAILAISVIIGLITYIFNAIGLYTMAKNRQINNPWLAFVPIANNYILGSLINDTVSIGSWHIPYAKIFLSLLSFGSAIVAAFLGMIPYLGILFGFLLSLSVSVYYYAALFRLFALYDEKHKVVFLVLSILLPFLSPIFIFAIRHKQADDKRFETGDIIATDISSKSIIGLSLGIISIVGAFPLLGSSLFSATVGLIFSMLALKELKEEPHGIALAGLICSIGGLVLTLIFFFIVLAIVGIVGLGFANEMINLY